MKTIYSFILIILASGCPQEDIKLASVQYEAISRGLFYKTQIVEGQITVQRTRSETDIEKIACKSADWKQLKAIVAEIDPTLIGELKAPSAKSHYDAAAIASLTVQVDGKTYTSNSFDHGNPPKELKPLVDYVLQLSEKVEKP